MTQVLSASARITALKAEIEELQQSAISELKERRRLVREDLAQVDADLAELLSVRPERNVRTRLPKKNITPRRNLPLQELKMLLAQAPEKTLNIRKENLDLRKIKTLASANPHLLRLGGHGPWPTVTLLK